MVDADFETVTCSRLIVRSRLKPEAGYEVTVSAGDDHAGLWIASDGDKGPIVAVYQQEGRTCVGLYAPKHKDVVNLGLAVGKDGEPFIQVSMPGSDDVYTLPASKLIKLIKWARAEEKEPKKPAKKKGKKS